MGYMEQMPICFDCVWFRSRRDIFTFVTPAMNDIFAPRTIEYELAVVVHFQC